MANNSIRQQVALAAHACEAKKAHDISILQLEAGAFTDFMVLASAANGRQAQAIADEVQLQILKATGTRPNSTEGYQQAEWVLLDYVDFVLHVFVEQKRVYYGLDRLWKNAKIVTAAELESKKAAAKAAPAKMAAPTKKKAMQKKKTPTKKTTVKKAATKKPAVKKSVKKPREKATAKKKVTAKKKTKKK